MSQKFQLGDFITGIDGTYTITNDKSICEVVGVSKESGDWQKILVKVVDHSEPYNIGCRFDVYSNHFALVPDYNPGPAPTPMSAEDFHNIIFS